MSIYIEVVLGVGSWQCAQSEGFQKFQTQNEEYASSFMMIMGKRESRI